MDDLSKKAIRKLKRLAHADTETGHFEGDAILCKLLDALGYGDVVVEWHKLSKWYA